MDDNYELTPAQTAFYGALLVGQARIYDVLLLMYAKMDPEGAIGLKERHEHGLTYFPPPSYREDEEDA